MDKRYQVFVSSTFADLQEERSKVIQALMVMECIPAGMELFPAMDEEQFEFIKRVIDDCDYYILIIGGRYGSVSTEGISYTGMEYDYAVQKGLKVLAFVHKNPELIQFSRSEAKPELRAKLQTFRDKVTENRLVKFWETANELPGLVIPSLQMTIRTYPAIGWVKANQVASNELLLELNDLRKKNSLLEGQIEQLRADLMPRLDNLASLEEKIKVQVNHFSSHTDIRVSNVHQLSWKEIFGKIAPKLIEKPLDHDLNKYFANLFMNDDYTMYEHVDDESWQTMKVHLMALNLISVIAVNLKSGDYSSQWSLTERGERLLLELRSVKSST